MLHFAKKPASSEFEVEALRGSDVSVLHACTHLPTDLAGAVIHKYTYIYFPLSPPTLSRRKKKDVVAALYYKINAALQCDCSGNGVANVACIAKCIEMNRTLTNKLVKASKQQLSKRNPLSIQKLCS